MTVTSENHPLLTVSQLTQAIKQKLESSFPSVWLQGEISNLKKQTSGHLYFSLKDAQAQLSAVMFKGDCANLKMLPKDGSHVVVRGEINVYPPSGKYQMLVRELKLVGVGELLMQLEELKSKLHQKGYFKNHRKKPLPKFPKVIGVVTSPTGAVIQDILNVLTRRFSGFKLILNPVKVQGDGAAEEISKAIHFFNDYALVDVMIIGRGGGSIEDLWAFNEEIVADAIYASHIPIVCAVGHETDHCIADYVADVRAPTPSAAAEIVMAEKSQHLSYLTQMSKRLSQNLQHRIQQGKSTLLGVLRHPIFNSPYALLGQWMQRIDDTRDEADGCIKQNIYRWKLKLEAYQLQAQALRPHARIFYYQQKIAQFRTAIDHSWNIKQQNKYDLFNKESKQRQLFISWQRAFTHHQQSLQKLTNALNSVDPKNLLKKGYAILFAENEQSVIKSIYTVSPHQTVKVLLGDGELLTEIKEVKKT